MRQSGWLNDKRDPTRGGGGGGGEVGKGFHEVGMKSTGVSRG